MNQLFTLFLSFLRIGAVMFGGHYAMIPILRHDVIARHGWIGEKEFLDLWAISESTPGPTALNAATYVGYKTQGLPGAMVATLGVVMVPFLVMLVITAGVRKYYDHFVVRSILYGLRGAIIALVVSALISIVTGVYKGLNAWQAGTMNVITIVALLLVVFLKQNPLVALGLSALLGLGLGFLGLWG